MAGVGLAPSSEMSTRRKPAASTGPCCVKKSVSPAERAAYRTSWLHWPWFASKWSGKRASAACTRCTSESAAGPAHPAKRHTNNTTKDRRSSIKVQCNNARPLVYSRGMRKRLVNLAIALPLFVVAADTGTLEPKDLAQQLHGTAAKPL